MRVPCFGNAVVPVLVILTTLFLSALGCGLFGGSGPEVEPTPEPDIGATVAAAISDVVATREAASPSAAATSQPASPPVPSETPAAAPSTQNAVPKDRTETLSTVGPDSTWGSLFDAFTERSVPASSQSWAMTGCLRR